MQKHIDKLMIESTQTVANSNTAPALLGLTRATTNLIYQDLVAVQPTSNPVAALYGVKYLNPNKDLTFVTGATYGGKYGEEERKTMKTLEVGNAASIAKGEAFLYQNVVFKAVADNAIAAGTDLDTMVSKAIIDCKIRMAPEAAPTSKFEQANSVPADARFEINRWQATAQSRKLKTELTVELAQDLEASGFNTANLLEDLLATQMAEEINKDIMQSMVTVSHRYKDALIPDGVLDLSVAGSSVEQARNLYRYVCDMVSHIERTTSYTATYVQASSRVGALLTASGWVKDKPDDQPDAASATLKNGLHLYKDNTSPFDYIIVGVKSDFGDEETVASLFYAPYADGISESGDPTDHLGAYKVINDPTSLQPKVALLVRYALSVNPYTMGLDDENARIVDSTDLDQFVGQSQMSVLLNVKLPKLV